MPNGQMQLVQPILRPAMALPPGSALFGGNMMRAGGPPPGMQHVPGKQKYSYNYVNENEPCHIVILFPV